MEECIFCKIAKKEAEAKIEYEDEQFVVFHDLYPKAPLHLLLIPRKHIHSVDHLEERDTTLMGELILLAKKVARDKSLKGYQLQINVGREGGQMVDHLHLHLLANYGKDKNI